jgi:ribose 5-phosphate isomerase B
MKELVIGCDHAGYRLKEFLKKNLTSMGYTFRDFGTYSEESVDYPDIIHPLARSIDEGEFERGIIICGTGIGASMTANKYPGVRAALCWNIDIARLSREHNDANVLALSGRFLDPDIALQMAYIFLTTSFEGGRHERRVLKIAR